MAKICAVCGKSKTTGLKISHSNIKTKRRWRPNIQKINVSLGGVSRRANICTRCLKSGKVQRAL